MKYPPDEMDQADSGTGWERLLQTSADRIHSDWEANPLEL
jgi:hypothetical protein